MKNDNYFNQIEVSASQETIFKALNEGLNTWWGTTTAANFKKDGQFTVTFENGNWWTFKILEYTPNKELIWKCIDGEPEFNKEWIGHVLHWRIKATNHKTILKFHQTGLTPQLHCYNICSKTWNMFITERLVDFLKNKKESN